MQPKPPLRPALFVFALLAACGARTPLDAPELDSDTLVDALADGPRVDAPRDAGPEADVPEPLLHCRALRVHTRLGFVTTVRPGIDQILPAGWTWQLGQSPSNSHAQLLQDGSLDARITPDLVGTYELLASRTQSDGSTLRCPVTLLSDPPDPACPGYALIEPVVTPVPQGTLQVAWSETWGDARGAPQTLADDDVAARVATVLWEQPGPAGAPTAAAALAAVGSATEATLSSQADTVPSFVGRSNTLSNGWLTRRSLFRTDRATDEGSLRDQLAFTLGHAVPPGPAHTGAGAFYLDLTTVLLPATGRVVTALTVSPVAAYDDATVATSIRVGDLANATAFAPVGSTLDARCHAVTSTRDPTADLLWLVDTSPSIYDDQERIGSTASRFFEELSATGLDFRMGVLEAGSLSFNPSGFQWIGGADPQGATSLAYQVTEQRFRGDSNDSQQPYHLASVNPSQAEEPMAAGVLATQAFEARVNDPDANHHWRTGATHIMFFVTDEFATENDWGRFFSRNPAMWGDGSMPATAQRISNFFTSRNILPFGMVPIRSGSDPCSALATLDACVISLSGGSYLPINLTDGAAAERALQGMLSRVADSAAGGSSELQLPVTPISASLRVRVDGAVVPRSHAEGFDYEDGTRALIFRGAQYRPRMGSVVRAAYFVWQ